MELIVTTAGNEGASLMRQPRGTEEARGRPSMREGRKRQVSTVVVT